MHIPEGGDARSQQITARNQLIGQRDALLFLILRRHGVYDAFVVVATGMESERAATAQVTRHGNGGGSEHHSTRSTRSYRTPVARPLRHPTTENSGTSLISWEKIHYHVWQVSSNQEVNNKIIIQYSDAILSYVLWYMYMTIAGRSVFGEQLYLGCSGTMC